MAARVVVAVLLVAAAGAAVWWTAGATGDLSLEELDLLRDRVRGIGPAAPLVFVAVTAVAITLFVPGLFFMIFAGLVFGPVWGAACSVAAATIGASASFLVSRYLARGLVEARAKESGRLGRLDAAVRRHGWRAIVITRLVPVFPYNVQNYLYGLTGIRLRTYVPLSAACMTPAAVAYALAGSSLATVGEDPGRTLAYLGGAAILFVALSFVPALISRNNRDEYPNRPG